MKRIFSLILALAAAFAFAACAKPTTPSDHQQITRPSDEPGTIKDTDLSVASATIGPRVTLDPGSISTSRSALLYWDAIRTGGGTQTGSRYEIYPDASKFESRFGAVARDLNNSYTAEDFKRMFVVAVYDTVPTGGYSYSAENAVVSNGVVRIDIKKNIPGPGTMVTQAFEEHCILVAIDRTLYSDDVKVELYINGMMPSFGAIG